jgi:hypothetical protein
MSQATDFHSFLTTLNSYKYISVRPDIQTLGAGKLFLYWHA